MSDKVNLLFTKYLWLLLLLLLFKEMTTNMLVKLHRFLGIVFNLSLIHNRFLLLKCCNREFLLCFFKKGSKSFLFLLFILLVIEKSLLKVQFKIIFFFEIVYTSISCMENIIIGFIISTWAYLNRRNLRPCNFKYFLRALIHACEGKISICI